MRGGLKRKCGHLEEVCTRSVCIYIENIPATLHSEKFGTICQGKFLEKEQSRILKNC